MTDQELQDLRDLMATKVMGWIWNDLYKCWFIKAKKEDDLPKIPGTTIDKVPNPACPCGEYIYLFLINGWHPDDPTTGQIWMIIRKMREQLPDGSDGFNFNLNWQAHKGITVSLAQFHKIDPFICGQGADDNPCIAVMLAAVEAKAALGKKP